MLPKVADVQVSLANTYTGQATDTAPRTATIKLLHWAGQQLTPRCEIQGHSSKWKGSKRPETCVQINPLAADPLLRNVT